MEMYCGGAWEKRSTHFTYFQVFERISKVKCDYMSIKRAKCEKANVNTMLEHSN